MVISVLLQLLVLLVVLSPCNSFNPFISRRSIIKSAIAAPLFTPLASQAKEPRPPPLPFEDLKDYFHNELEPVRAWVAKGDMESIKEFTKGFDIEGRKRTMIPLYKTLPSEMPVDVRLLSPETLRVVRVAKDEVRLDTQEKICARRTRTQKQQPNSKLTFPPPSPHLSLPKIWRSVFQMV